MSAMSARMNGIDISSYQATLNPTAMTGTDFIIVKATGGESYKNPYFERHIASTLSSGKCAGAYHYAREASCKGGPAQEAAHFLSVVRPYIGRITLALDWEEELSLGPDWALEWLETVFRETGVKPWLYTSQAVCAAYDWSKVVEAGYKLWMAQYASAYIQKGYRETPWQKGSIGAWPGYIMHQYSGTGRIDGYGGNLDLDLFYGSAQDWMREAWPKAQEKPKEAQEAPQEPEDDDTVILTKAQVEKMIEDAKAETKRETIEAVKALLVGQDTQPSDWATRELEEAVADGITDGARPQGYATRQEVAIMCERTLNAASMCGIESCK